MTGEVSGAEKLAQEFVGRVFDHLHLFDNNALLTLKVFALKARGEKHVGDKIESLLHATVCDLHGKAGHLVHGEGVKVAAQAVGFDSYIERRASACALENSMFNE